MQRDADRLPSLFVCDGPSFVVRLLRLSELTDEAEIRIGDHELLTTDHEPYSCTTPSLSEPGPAERQPQPLWHGVASSRC